MTNVEPASMYSVLPVGAFVGESRDAVRVSPTVDIKSMLEARGAIVGKPIAGEVPGVFTLASVVLEAVSMIPVSRNTYLGEVPL